MAGWLAEVFKGCNLFKNNDYRKKLHSGESGKMAGSVSS